MRGKSLNLLAAMVVAGASVAVAQDLGTTSIADQLNTGTRGNAVSTGTSFGNSLTDGTEFLDYSGADATGTIRYINAYTNSASGAGDTANGESPVVAITNVGNPDRNLLGNSIIANTRPGASDGNTVLLISDDGGQNTLVFGDPASTDYFVEADVFCYPLTDGQEWVMVALRAARDGAALTGGAYSIDRDGSYAIVYRYGDATATATAFADASVGLNAGGTGTSLGTGAVTAGQWHTFRIEAVGTNIIFSINGTEIANVTDATVANGRGALGYRELGTTSASERAGTFDNLKAGPASASVREHHWSLY